MILTQPVEQTKFFNEIVQHQENKMDARTQVLKSHTMPDFVITGGGKSVYGLHNLNVSGTATSDDRRITDYNSSPQVQQIPQDHLEVESVSEARLNLLARQYEGTANNEDSARLLLLTERLRRISPRVTSSDMEHLSNLVDEIEEISLAIDFLDSEYGI